jgi:hypothetical protein
MKYKFLFKFIIGLIYTLFGLLIIPYVALFTIIGGNIWNKFFILKGCNVITPYSGVCSCGTKGCNLDHIYDEKK